MGLFDDQIEEVRRLAGEWSSEGKARALGGVTEPWPRGPGLVLEEDTAFELGNPAVASLSLLMWSDGGGVEDGRVTVVGPDVPELRERSVPFAQVLVVGGSFTDEYESYRDIRDAVYDTHLVGFSVRTMPSRQTIWCRVSRDAVARGFSLGHLGAALLASLKGVEGVERAEAVFVTSSAADVKRLAGAAAGAQRIVDAMMKMYGERNFDCSTCEYKDVCESVDALKVMRKKLLGEKAG